MAAIPTWYLGDGVTIWIVNVLLQVSLVASATLLLSRCFKRHASLQHALLCCGLMLTLASPATALLMQSSRAGLLSVSLLDDSRETTDVEPNVANTTVAPSDNLAPENAVIQMEPSQATSTASNRPIELGKGDSDRPLSATEARQPNAAAPSAHSKTIAVAVTPQPKASSLPVSPAVLLRNAATYGLLFWQIGAVLLLIRLLRGWWRLTCIMRKARPFEVDSLAMVVADVCSELGLNRQPQLVSSPHVASPLAAGILRARVIFPEGLTNEVSPHELREVLIHEIAHICRRDQVVVLLQHVAAAVFWIHPLVHILNRQLARAREEVCDNYVLAASTAPGYGRTLLRLAELIQRTDPLPASAGLLASRWRLESRVEGLLDQRRNVKTRLTKRASAVVLLTALAIVVMAAAITIAPRSAVGGTVPNQASGGDLSRGEIITIDGRIVGAAEQPAAKTFFVQAKTGDPPPTAPKDVDLFAIELIAADLADARASMSRCDADGDGQLDEDESARLGWRLDPKQFDLDKNRKLTQLEMAVHYAFRRQQAGIERVDLTVMGRVLSRYDKNGDRTLSPAEIRDGRWPPDPEAFDLDGNGRLNAFELAAGISMKRRQREENGITGFDTKRAIEFISQHDKSRDVTIDREEFAAADSPFDFNQLDVDRNGALIKDEIALGYAKRREKYNIKLVDQQKALQRLNRHDRNFDKELDEDEIMAAQWPENPSRYDIDKDNRLSRFELEAALARERRERGVSADDIAAAARLIARYDKNRNGQIDLSEIEGDPPAGVPRQHRVTADILIDFDENADQKLNRDETAAFVASQRAD